MTDRIREGQMFLPLAMSTEASTMGIMLIDASAEAQQEKFSLLNFPPQVTPRPNVATHAAIGLSWHRGMEEDQCQWGSEQLGGWWNTQVLFLEHFPWPSCWADLERVSKACVYSHGFVRIHPYGCGCQWMLATQPLHHIQFLYSPCLFSMTKAFSWNLELNPCITTWEANIWITGIDLFSAKCKTKIKLTGITIINNQDSEEQMVSPQKIS